MLITYFAPDNFPIIMKSASVQTIKQELMALPPSKLLDYLLRLVKFKKENKDLLHFLLFESHYPAAYLDSIKLEMDEDFELLPIHNWYNAKKGLRKILRNISKYSKHVNTKEFEIEMRFHFCDRLHSSNVPYRKYKALSNIFDAQLLKVGRLIEGVHEDLQSEYTRKYQQLLN